MRILIIFLFSVLLPTISYAALSTITLPTATDGEVPVTIDTTTNLPIGASDDRAKVEGASLTFLPKNAGEPLRITWNYSLRFVPGIKIRSITIESEDGKELATVVDDASPQLNDAVWSGQEKSRPFNKATFEFMNSNEVWMLLRRITVKYDDNKVSKLHQLIIESPAQRRNLINKLWTQLQSESREP